MIKSRAIFGDFLTCLSEKPSIASATRRIGAASRTFYLWFRESQEAMARGDTGSVYFLSWPEGMPGEWFHLLVPRAKSIWKAALTGSIISEAAPLDEGGGVLRILTGPEGIIYEKMDPVLFADMVELGLQRADDPWVRDEQGKRVPCMVREPLAVHGKIHVSRSVNPEVFGDRRELHVSGGLQTSGVVTVQGLPPRPALPAPAHISSPVTTEATSTEQAPVVDTRTDLDKTLAHLDSLEQTEMIQSFRRDIIMRATQGVAAKRGGFRMPPPTPPLDEEEKTGDGSNANGKPAKPSYQSRQDHIGRGGPGPGAVRVAGGEQERRFKLNSEGYPDNSGQGAAQPRKMV